MDKNSGAGESILSAPFLLETICPLSCAVSCTLSCPLSEVMLHFRHLRKCQSVTGKLLLSKNRDVILGVNVGVDLGAILDGDLNGKYHLRQNFLKPNVYFHASFGCNNSTKGSGCRIQYETVLKKQRMPVFRMFILF